MSEVNSRNFKAVEAAINKLWREISECSQKIVLLEQQNVILRTELSHTKQTALSAAARGTGPTER